MPLRFCSYKIAPCLTERQGALKSCILNPLDFEEFIRVDFDPFACF